MVKDKMKKVTREETTPILQIYHEAVQEVFQYEDQENIASIMPTFSSTSSTQYKRLPPLPNSIDNLYFNGEWSKTLNNEEFILGPRDGASCFQVTISSFSLLRPHSLC